jgi:hypothetical protein
VSLPLEIRLYNRKMTMDDLNNGMQGVRLQVGPIAWAMFMPAVMQYRMKLKDGWSPWVDAAIVREEDAPDPGIDHSAASSMSSTGTDKSGS